MQLLSYLLTCPVSGLLKTYRRRGIGLELLDCLSQDLDSWVVITVAVQLLVSFVVKVAVAVPEYLWMLLTVLLVWSLSAMVEDL